MAILTPHRAAVLALVVGAPWASGCEPLVVDGSYFCGPNRSCPPGQGCDDQALRCGNPELVSRFECPPGSQNAEPDDILAEAIGLGETECGESLVSERQGCISTADDVDIYRLVQAEPCERRNDLRVGISHPIAFAPMQLEIVGADGQVMGEGVVCTVPDSTSGREQVCAEIEIAPGTYYVRIAAEVGTGLDCNGDCAHNEYRLDVSMPP